MLSVRLITSLIILMSVQGCAHDTMMIRDFCILVDTPIYNYNECQEPAAKRVDNINAYYEEFCL